mmetsp:Transcript_9959/g.34326  ORF Transcript_9959/g.34326 Transcript_9959/m.34326 type:complete len:279 (-) Transcript_9959:150-986(-)
MSTLALLLASPADSSQNEFMFGFSLSATATAFTTKSLTEATTPSSLSSFLNFRRGSSSTSMVAYWCGNPSLESRRPLAMILLMVVCGTSSWSSAAASSVAAGAGVEGAGLEGRGEAEGGDPSRSPLTTMPSGPVPETEAGSTFSCLASRSTAGPRRLALGPGAGPELEEVEAAWPSERDSEDSGAPVSAAAYWASFATSSCSSARMAIGVPTMTSLVPPGTRILARKPSSCESISMDALSVSISATTSPAATSSPSDFVHLDRLPFSIVGLRLGMVSV